MVARHFHPRDFYGINVRLRHEVVEIIPDQRSIKVMDIKAGKTNLVPYDDLLIATGATPQLPFPQASGVENILTIKSLSSGIYIKEYLEKNEINRAVVVGGG